jgi:predicted GNAT superfamily acetyltransferase
MGIKKNLCPETILFSHVFSVILKETVNKECEVLIRKDFGFNEEKDSKEKIKLWKDAYKTVFKKLQEKGYLINEYVEKRPYSISESWKITWDKKTIIDMI